MWVLAPDKGIAEEVDQLVDTVSGQKVTEWRESAS